MKYYACLLVSLLMHLTIAAASAADVREFGAVGDGVADDTDAIEKAIRESGGVIDFSKGDYRITRTIEIVLSEGKRISLNGHSGSGRVVMNGSGPAFRFIGTHDGSSLAGSFAQGVLDRERMPQIDGLEIIGDHAEADGVEFIRVMQPTIRGSLIRNLRNGVILSVRNRNVIIESSHIYNCSGIGVFFDNVDLHQAIIHGSHISYCKSGGIRIIGGAIRNIQITGNDIEYNYDEKIPDCADVLIDVRDGSIREGTISGNTIQARPTSGGANVRFIGNSDTPDKAGLWSITGNHISNQEVNVHLNNARGIAISGNTFILGRKNTFLIEKSRNIGITGNVVDYNPDYYRSRTYSGSRNGVTIRESKSIMINGLLLDGSTQGSAAKGGSVEVLKSSEVTISGSQIVNSAHRGVYVADSRNVQLLGNTIIDQGDGGAAAAAIEVTGESRNVIIRGNIIGSDDAGGVVAEEGTSIVENNVRAVE